jgi:superfamily II helicase
MIEYDPNIKKVCTKCKVEKFLSEFSKHSSAKYKRNSVCVKCDSKRVVEWQRNNKDRFRANQKKFANKESTKRYRKDWQLKKNFNISIEEYERLVKKQKGKCGICKKEDSLHVDHNHISGAVRGLLCSPCNLALGLFKDDKTILKNAIKYLNKDATL